MIRAYVRERRGAAAVEFALTLGLFTIALPSVVDLGIYAYDTMQVQNSAQMGVQAAWASCNRVPVTDSSVCPNASSALTAAVAKTALGSAVTTTTSSVSEGYYCLSSGALSQVGNLGTFASGNDLASKNSGVPTCSDGSGPGEYIKATVSYAYTPVFANASVGSLLGTSIQSTAWMRLL